MTNRFIFPNFEFFLLLFFYYFFFRKKNNPTFITQEIGATRYLLSRMLESRILLLQSSANKVMYFVSSHFFPNVPLTSWTLFHHFGVPVVLEVPKSDEKVFNWSGVHSERSDFLQNPYFRAYLMFSSKLREKHK